MRARRKKFLFIVFLLITVLMFLHSWKTYLNPTEDELTEYAKKHHNKKHPLQHKHQYQDHRHTV